MKIAIIGAGMAGLTAARRLSDQLDITLFDKSRGVGGRMSTRYAGNYEFDHGAQYFTLTDPDFEALIAGLTASGAAQRWDSQGHYLTEDGMVRDTGKPRWVGAPRMNRLPKSLAGGLDMHLGRRVETMSGEAGHLQLHFDDGRVAGPFDRVICTAPAPQAAAMLPPGSPLQPHLSRVNMHAGFALMVGLDAMFDPGWDSLRLAGLPVSWIARNSAKPGRPDGICTLVIHAAPDWSDRYAEADRNWVREQLLDCASTLCGQDLNGAAHIDLHRWLYAYADTGVGQDCLVDDRSGIVLAGDWCVGGRVEGAFISGRAAARAVLVQHSGASVS